MISAQARPWAHRTAGSRSEQWVVALHVVRTTHRGALIWGAVFGLFVIATVTAYVTGFPTQQERQQLATSIRSFFILLGPAQRAETVAGFTTWRVMLAVTVMGAIWAMLTSTSRLRGDEDSGRWELLLAAPLSKREATVQVLLGLGAVLLLQFAVCAVFTMLAGQVRGARFALGGSLLLAAGLCAGSAMFLAIGALASQIAQTRGQAVRICAAVLGVSYLVRLIADSRTSLGWLRWFSPIGWLEELHPLRNPQPQALVLVVALVLVCSVLAVLLAERRDLSASLLQEGAVRRHETAWLGGALQLAYRLMLPAAIGWLVGSGLMAFIMGTTARSASQLLSASPTITAALGRLGIRRATEGYLGLEFLLLSMLLAVLAAGQLAAIRDEETSGRLENLLVRPLSRVAWLTERLAASAVLIVAAGLGIGLATWLGGSSQRIGVSLPTLLAAGLNITAPALLVLGAGALIFAVRGRLAAPLAYAIVAWSFVVNLLGTFLKGWDWLRDTSVFTHIALAPSVAPDWGSVAALVGIGLAAAVLGLIGFRRRDVEYG